MAVCLISLFRLIYFKGRKILRSMKLFLIATTLALFFMSCHFDDSHDHNRHNHSITYTSNNGHFTVTPLFDPDGNPKVGVKIEIELPILDRNGDFIENAC